jgi:hypothetical protein
MRIMAEETGSGRPSRCPAGPVTSQSLLSAASTSQGVGPSPSRVGTHLVLGDRPRGYGLSQHDRSWHMFQSLLSPGWVSPTRKVGAGQSQCPGSGPSATRSARLAQEQEATGNSAPNSSAWGQRLGSQGGSVEPSLLFRAPPVPRPHSPLG